jgi:N-sulfoglucosamine sulfohydrolase
MNRPTLITLFLALVTCAADAPAKSEPASKPNIIFITADDMNYDSAGCYGCPVKDLTPNLDRLAAEGIRFHYAYSTTSISTACRRSSTT